MTGPPKLKSSDGRNQNVKHKRSWTNDGRRDSEQRHYRNVTRRTCMADRRVKKRDQSDGEKKKNEMRRVHFFVMSSRVETSLTLGMPALPPAKSSQRFLDFARNDKNGAVSSHSAAAQHFRNR